MRKRILSLVVAGSLIMSALTGCGGAKQAILPEELTVTYVTAPLNVPSIVEKEKDIFEETFKEMGIEIEYAELTSGADQTQALASGDVQLLYAVGASSVILSAANGADIKVLNMYSRSPEAFCMFGKDETVVSPEDLRGKTIAGPAGTNLHELLAAYLAAADMSMEDVNFVSMSIPEAKAALDGGSVDAALLAGATAYQAMQQGYYMIADGKGLIDAPIVVAVTEEFYNKYPEIIEKFTEAQEKIVAYMEENPDEALRMTAEELDLTVEAVAEMYEYYNFSLEITEEDKKGLQNTADFMFESGMIEQAFDVNQLFWE